MTPDLSDLRRRAAEELSGFEAELLSYERAFRDYDPEGGALLDRVEELVAEQQPGDDGRTLKGPDEIAVWASLSGDHPELQEMGMELLQRLKAFREETGTPSPSEADRPNDT